MRLPVLRVLFAAALALSFTACAPSTDPGDDDSPPDPQTQDNDGDGFTPQLGDCDDTDDTVYPGAPELEDGKDNNCNGQFDDDLPTVDDDSDGYSNVEGDCDDDEPLVNPGCVEVNVRLDEHGQLVPEGVDNDCDGLIDEGTQPCDTALNGEDPYSYAQAMELCDFVTDAHFSAGVPATQRAILPQFGTTYLPHAGAALAVLSTGAAMDHSSPSWVNPSPGTAAGGPPAAHPSPQPDPADGCGQADPATVNDYISLTFQIQVPRNANALTYDFNFMSAEFPTYVCTAYDDTFLAMLHSEQFDGNISFDDAGRPVTINVGFFDVCNTGLGPNCAGAAELAGTGFDTYGGTGWLHTIAPVTPGETITLTFHLFDEGDSILDSLVLLDNVQWLGVPVDGPVTIPRELADEVHALLAQGVSVDEIRARY